MNGRYLAQGFNENGKLEIFGRGIISSDGKVNEIPINGKSVDQSVPPSTYKIVLARKDHLIIETTVVKIDSQSVARLTRVYFGADRITQRDADFIVEAQAYVAKERKRQADQESKK